MPTPPPAPARFALLDDDDALPSGTRFGELEIQRVIGVGGFGIVYLAHDHALEREVALKEYMPGSLAGRNTNSKQVAVRSDGHVPTYALGLRSFVNEARLLARFNHPSLVKVYRFWEENGTAYMVMPYLQGRTLREARRAMDTPPDQAWILSVINPLLDALEQLHRETVYHRDIAPDNVLLPPNELPVLLDFGAARRAISDRTQTFTAILKPSYAPIEQYAESTQMRQGPWTDIYALGAVIQYLLKGTPPSPATSRALQDDVSSLEHEDLPGTTPEFRAMVDWMLSVKPTDRPQSIGELREVLQGRAAVPPRPARRQPPPPVDPSTVAPPVPVPPPVVAGPPPYTVFAPTMVATSAAKTAPPVPMPPTTRPRPVTASFAPTQQQPRSIVNDPDETVVIRQALAGRSGQTGLYGAAHAPRAAMPPIPQPPPAPPRSGSRVGLWAVIAVCVLLLVGMGVWMVFFDHAQTRNAAAVVEPKPAVVNNVAPPPQVQTLPVAQAPAASAPAPLPALAEAAAASEPVAAVMAPASAIVAAPTSAPTPAPATATAPPPVQTQAQATAPPPAVRDAAVGKPTDTPRVAAGTRPATADELRKARELRDARLAREGRSRTSTSNEPMPVSPTYSSNGNAPSGSSYGGSGNNNNADARPATPAPAPAVQPQAANPSSPREACGGRVFIALDICMEDKCKQPRFASHPQCQRVREIEERRRPNI